MAQSPPSASFAPATTYNIGTASSKNPFAVAVADFNGDGKPDLVEANGGTATGTVGVLLNNGDGTFQPVVYYGTDPYPYWVAVGDFNGDGKPDIVIADNTNSAITVMLGNGDGTFQPGADYGVGSYPYSIAVGDLNGDGKADLAVANYISGNVSVLLGKGDGTFDPAANFASGTDPYSVAVGDFNRDGKPDLVVANSQGSDISVLLGNGDGTFQAAVHYPGQSTYITSLAVGDFNSDGNPDVAAACENGGVNVFLGKGDGTFQSFVNYPAGSEPRSVMVGDFNLDGKPDLAAASANTGNISVLLGNGDGTFQAAVNFGFGQANYSVAVGDFNGDQKPDLAVANNNINGDSGSIGVLLNTTVLPTSPSVISLTSSLNPSTFTQPITFTALVSPASGSGQVPTGTVTFNDGIISLATGTLNGSGQATLTITTLAGGTHNITAIYSGDTAYTESASAAIVQNVNPLPTTTDLQPVTFTAMVKRPLQISDYRTINIPVAEGSVTLFGTVKNVSGTGQAVFTLPPSWPAAPGPYSVSARYNGTPNYLSSTSTGSAFIINPAPVTITASANLQSPGITVTASSPYAVPSGSVQLQGVGPATALNSSGQATLNSVFGYVSVFYIPNSSNFLPTSAYLFVPAPGQVQAPTNLSITSSVNPSGRGQPVTFTAVVTSAIPFDHNGYISVYFDGVPIFQSPINQMIGPNTYGVIFSNITWLPPGAHQITAVYGGDPYFASSSGSLLQTVQ